MNEQAFDHLNSILTGSKINTGYGHVRRNDVPWNEKKVAIIETMQTMEAVGKRSARGANQIAEYCGLTQRDVRHYCYHAAAGGLVKVLTDISGLEDEIGEGYGFYLTAKGRAVDTAAVRKTL